jgi:hypothetical protein
VRKEKRGNRCGSVRASRAAQVVMTFLVVVLLSG